MTKVFAHGDGSDFGNELINLLSEFVQLLFSGAWRGSDVNCRDLILKSKDFLQNGQG